MRQPHTHLLPIPVLPASRHRPAPAVDIVLSQARRLHRAARLGSISVAMPAIRRAHAAGVFSELTVSALYRQRQLLQRKHFLRTLAIEADFPDWERFRPELRRLVPEAVANLQAVEALWPSLNLWFSTEAQAAAHAREHGGQVLRVGRQAMVVPADAPVSFEGTVGA